MIAAALPADETGRLQALHALGVLDAPADPVLDGLVRCAAALTGCPIAFVSLVDSQRQWFAARHGSAVEQTPREISFCAHTILTDGFFEVPDAHLDARFVDNPLVTGPLGVRFYAGVPLRLDGHALGALCVLDRRPRRLDDDMRARLLDMAAAVSHWLHGVREHGERVANDARLADFVRAGADRLLECDADLRIQWCVDGMASQTQDCGPLIGQPLPDAELLDETGDALVPPQRLGDALRRMQRSVTLRIAREMHGRQHVFELSGLPRTDALGRLAGWRLTVRDVTTLVEERRTSRERLRMLDKTTRQAPGVIFQVRRSANGWIDAPYVSPRVTDLYEVDIETARRQPVEIARRIHHEDRADFFAEMERSARTLTPFRMSHRVLLPLRGLRWVECVAAAELDPAGGVRWYGFAMDVTERRALDAAVAESRERQRAAEAASRDKSAFLSRLSHELRTPLNAVLGFAQLLQADRQEPLKPMQRDRVSQVQRAGESLVALLDEVMELGRVEHGGRAVEPRPVSLRRVLDDALSLVTPQAQMAGVRLMPVQGVDGIWLQADRRGLQQVLVNLLVNGIKYNRRDGRVTVVVRREGQEGVIEVCDEGPGIPPERLAQLFQPFNRLGAENSSVPGSGLGLVIARQLVGAMGGRIGVDSKVGVGSIFRVALPMADSGSATAPVALSEPMPDEPPRRATLLYIEDEPVNAMLLAEALRSQPQWQLVLAADGLEGLARARALHPDIVLTDLNLPGLTGLEVVRALRDDPATRDIVCIALSADALPEQVERAREAGCDDYWTKPLDLARVVRRIAHLLRVTAI